MCGLKGKSYISNDRGGVTDASATSSSLFSSTLQIDILGQGRNVYLSLKHIGIFIITIFKCGHAHWSKWEAMELKLKIKYKSLHFLM